MAEVSVFRAEELSEADAVGMWCTCGGGGGGSGGWWWPEVGATAIGNEALVAEVAATVTEEDAAAVPDIEETSDTKMSGRWPLRA